MHKPNRIRHYNTKKVHKTDNGPVLKTVTCPHFHALITSQWNFVLCKVQEEKHTYFILILKPIHVNSLSAPH